MTPKSEALALLKIDSDRPPAMRPAAKIEAVDDRLRGRRPTSVTFKSHLFVVLEGDRPLAGGARFGLDDADEIFICRGERRAAHVETLNGRRRFTLELESPLLSPLHARLRREPDGWLVEDACSRNGTYLNGLRIARGLLGPDDVLEVGHTFLVIRAFPRRSQDAMPDIDSSALEAENPAFRTLVPSVAAGLEDLRRVARSSISVLLSGETGSGKEVLARGLHDLSQRPGPFVAINCSTLTNGLAESQLFGHVKGAFSGASADSVGFVRAAEGGTLLLDEVGDLAGTVQGALLRVLQEREVIPVGRARPQAVDVRFIATSPRSLDAAVERDRFRPDLLGRLCGFVHEMTPLRDRREDLGLLAAVLLRKAGASEGERLCIAPETGLRLVRHRWPFNVRELEQLLVRGRLLSADGVIHADPGAPVRVDAGPVPVRMLSPAQRELRERISEALASTHGNVTKAAQTLSKGRVQVHRLMRRLQIDPKQFRA
jgi:DNA-binding NtrC family response regulator